MIKRLFSIIIMICGVVLSSNTFAADMLDQPRSSRSFTVTSSDSTNTHDSSGSEEESAERVYEATRFLHTTGTLMDVDIATWRLKVKGKKIGRSLSLTYQDLSAMRMVKKEIVLVCPTVFTDRAEWEGVPLLDILERARLKDEYTHVIVQSIDGFQTSFSKDELDNHLIFVALKVNRVTLPKEHGYPARIVAEDITGGKWVKWIKSIEVQ